MSGHDGLLEDIAEAALIEKGVHGYILEDHL